jgi:serine/threonine protein kinase/tetratricopeptide (TPR) repeat protein
MVELVSSELIGKRYQLLDRLGAGGMGIVYRAADRLTGQIVALKQVISPQSDPDMVVTIYLAQESNFQLALAQEFRTLASLRHPNIISVLDYGFDQERRPYFTMDLLENAVTIIKAADDTSLAQKIDLIIQMLRSLTYLHRRAILHLDLKPANVMVTGGQVKVLDFGLSSGRGELHGETFGTMAYIAPEMLDAERFGGYQIGDATDLYSVGTIAYELLTGQHPFGLDDLGQLISDVLNTEPDMMRLQTALWNSADGLDDPASVVSELVYIVERLLYKDPLLRFQHAEAVIDQLEAALGCPPGDSAEIRESFLQAAQFIGRSAELTLLSEQLDQAIEGTGSVWLVGGESGVGKSRLLDELRTVALVKGAMVLRGQTLREGGSPYQQWTDPLRRLVLATEITTKEAAVLKSIVPDIENLLGHSIPDAPPTDARAAQRRLLNAVASTFGKSSQPILLILEDLHWAENLEILKMLVPWTRSHPVLIVGSYRNDEQPDLPDRVPGVKRIALDRLNRDEIAALSVAMIGSAGQDESVVNLLQRETEGNIFFLVEVVRALAQEAGDLERIKDLELPKQVFAGGMHAIIEHRLERIPAWCWSLLKFAAVLGRELDLSVLRTMDEKQNIGKWLLACGQAAVLEVQEDSWRFVHSKLRDGVLERIPAQERRDLHYTAALAIERLYPNDPERSVALAYHFENAEVYEEAVDYWRQAADNAAHVYANEQAMSHYRHAITLAAKTEVEPDILAHACEGLGDIHMWLGEYQAAMDSFNDGLIWAGPKLSAFRRTVLNRKKGYVFEKWGKFDRAELCFEAALLNIVEIGNSEEAAHIYAGLALIDYRRERLDDAVALSTLSLTMAEWLKYKLAIAKAFNTLGMIAFKQGNLDQAMTYYLSSLAAWKEVDDDDGLSSIHNNLGVLYEAQGNSQQALIYYQRSIELSEKIGNRHGIARTSDNLAQLNRLLGQDNAAMEWLERSVGILSEIGQDDTHVFAVMWEAGVWQ